MSQTVLKAAKPQLKGLLRKDIKRNLIITFVITGFVGTIWKTCFANKHKQMYADFYKNYDIDKEFNTMRKKGLFDSCNPDDD